MIIGIDLGTTNSLACVYRNGHTELIPNALGEYMTKSAVSIMEDGTILVGTAAKERQFTHPERTAASFKRWMGTEKAVHIGDESTGVFLPHELSALVLKQLYEDARRYLGEEIEEAVISVPAYFDDNQRNATKLAAQLAGIPVKRLINEPSAAALRYNLNEPGRDCRLMVIDFGGGTLDVSIVECFENIIEIIAIAGDNRLGGDDIDSAIASYFCRAHSLSMDALSPTQRASLLRQSEAAKKALSNLEKLRTGSSDAENEGKSSSDAENEGKSSSDAENEGKSSSDAENEGKSSSDAENEGKSSSDAVREGSSSDDTNGSETDSFNTDHSTSGNADTVNLEAGNSGADLEKSKRRMNLGADEFKADGLTADSKVPVIRLVLDETCELSLDKNLLRQICQPYLNRMKAVIARAIRDSNLSPEGLDEIILVGGSARLAVLGDFLEELMGKRPALADHPENMVAEGTGICAGIKSRREELRDMVMTDVCPFSLGIAVCNDARDQNPHMATMIARSSMLPVSRKETFYTLSDFQTSIRLAIYQGEEYYAAENRKLGEMMMRVPADAAGEQFVDVAFAYDINGILHVEARASGGDYRETVIVNPKLQLGEDELQKKVEELKHLPYAAEGNQEDFLYIAKVERIYAELTGARREQAAWLLDVYRQVLRQGNLIEREKMRNYAHGQIEAWEALLSAEPWQGEMLGEDA